MAQWMAVLVLMWAVLQNFCTLVFSSYRDGPWRSSLDDTDSCWTNSECNRVMTTAHGGEWNLTFPYDSLPAFIKAFQDGADAVKGDFRVSKDNVGVVMHSSPIEFYESINCRGKYVENMLAEECTQCKMEITNYTFITVPDMLRWADGKVNVMLCVKEAEDVPRAISTLIENNATHRAFLELHLDELMKLEANNVEGWEKVYYVAELKSSDDLQRMLNVTDTMKARSFLLEFNDWEEWSADISSDISSAKALGFRTFAKSNSGPITATVGNHLHLFKTGFDVAYTYNLGNAVQARREVNTFRGIFPP